MGLILTGLLLGCQTTRTDSNRFSAIPVPRSGYFIYQQTSDFLSPLIKNRALRHAYVFPPLAVSAEGEALEALQPLEDGQGNLFWQVDNKIAGQLQLKIENALRANGFIIVPFQAVLEDAVGHRVLLVNTHYTEPFPLPGERDGPPRGWTSVITFRGVSFDTDLEPSTQRDLHGKQILLVTRFRSEMEAARFMGIEKLFERWFNEQPFADQAALVR
jgi:hypothetical protein